MKVSIITVVYNGEKTIERTLKSVIREKRCDSEIEYIIIDGKSTDNTMKIIDKYREFIDICISEKDLGINDALNKGISKATGDYYILVAADDELLPSSVQNFKQSIKEKIDVWCGAQICSMGGYYIYSYSDKNLTNLYKRCSLRHPATFFKKETVEEIGKYDLSLKIVGDRDIFLRLYLSGAKFQIEDIPIVLFDDKGVSSTNIKMTRKEDKFITKKYSLQTYNNESKLDSVFFLKLKKRIRTILFYTHTYQMVLSLLGKSDEFVSREDLVKYGLK